MRLREIVRATEWWEYKLVPIIASFYATLVLIGGRFVDRWPVALALLLSMVPGAAFVSVVNDVTDIDEDLAAGKPNRVVGKSRTAIAVLLAIPIAAGIAFAWAWRRDPLLMAFYLTAWMAFCLYSLPPFRLKVHGILGVLCDASGSNLFPMLVAVRLAGSRDLVWIASVAAWSLAFGIRGILWHQLGDRENDRNAGVRTFALRHSPQFVTRLTTFVIFPIELLGFASMLWQLRAPWTLALLAIYALYSLLRMKWRIAPVIVAPKPSYFIVMHDYYIVFFPMALLITAAVRHPIDAIAIVVHCALFPGRVAQTLSDFWRLRPPQLR